MKRKPFPLIPISAGTVANECFVCRTRPGLPVVLPKGVRVVCESCVNKMPKNATKAEGAEPELYCPVCGMKTIIVSFDAIECSPRRTALDYVAPYSAACSLCDSVLRTIHPTPEATLDYWRDHLESISRWS
jgi:hypothetical protein